MKTLEAILFSALFLTLVCIQSPVKSLSTITNDEANEFKIGETVEFNPLNKNCFKYYNTKDITIIFSFINLKFDFYYLEIQDPDGNEIEIHEFDDYYEFTLNKIGYHSFTIKSSYPYFGIVEKFTTFAPGEVIDTIDLNKEMYYNKLEFYLTKKYDPMKYIIEDLDSDKYVYFYSYDYINNIFKVCINENETCESNVEFFHFQKNNKYTIYIQLQDYFGEPKYNPYIIAPITKTTIETKNLGIFMNASPKIYNIEIENKEKYIYFTFYEKILIAYSNDKIENSNIHNITNLEFDEYDSSDCANKLNNTFSYAIIIVIPDIFKAEGVATRIALAENVVDSLKSEQLKNEEIIIDSDKSTILYLNSDYFYNNNDLEFYNILLTFSSSSKNMRYIHSSNLENKFDFLMNDYLHLPMYIDKDSKEQKIQFKVYYPRYTFFGAGDSEMFKLFYEYLKTPLYTDIDYDWESLLPLNVRVNSDLSPFYEFFNFYFNKFEDNINLYINKLYGETDLYECSDELDQNDLSILTTPINKCKDKKSIFNRLFTFKGTKILSGYLTPNSYFDVYLEMNDNSKKIKISPAFEGGVNSASKYIKKDIEYTVDFTVEHMVKIEVVENVEVTIYNDETNIKLDSKKPVQEIKGSNYKVKTNSDTMIYFYGKLFKYLRQKEIDPEQKGKYASIFSNKRVYYTIDSGFLGYNPLNIDLSMSYIDNYYIHIENLYEKMKNKLVENEKIFLYYLNEDDFDKNEEYDDYEEPKIDIEYQDSLNNPNNDYSFTVIPSNSREKSLIINNRNKGEIIYGVNFCGEPHEVNMTVKSIYDGEYIINFKKEEPLTVVNIDEYQTKLNFQSDKEFIFSYSFLDMADNNFIDSDDWLDERKEEESSNLKIIEVKDTSSDDNILSITFVPSIKNSNVKYIIVIAPKNGDNKKENFSNPCFIAKLVNDKKEGIKIQNWIDPGITSTITAEVDISDILNSKNNNYVVGIISQELRFNKQLNFYSAFEFTYEGKSKNDENDENDDDSKGNKTLVIVFSVVGAVIVIALILLIVCMIKKKRGSSSFDTDNNNENKLLSDM